MLARLASQCLIKVLAFVFRNCNRVCLSNTAFLCPRELQPHLTFKAFEPHGSLGNLLRICLGGSSMILEPTFCTCLCIRLKQCLLSQTENSQPELHAHVLQ
jgi:hypothetical protein